MDSIMDNEILCAANNTFAAWVKSLRQENEKLKIKARRLGIKLANMREDYLNVCEKCNNEVEFWREEYMGVMKRLDVALAETADSLKQVSKYSEKVSTLTLEIKGVRGTQANAIAALQIEREKVKRLEKELNK
jgi:hypothetical protein